MGKYKRCFQGWAEQGLYEELRRDGKTQKQAVKETESRFKEYDEGKPLSIFIK